MRWWRRAAFRWVMVVALGLLLILGGQALYQHFNQPDNTPAQTDPTPKPETPANKPVTEQIEIKPTATPAPTVDAPLPASTAPALWWWLLPLAGFGFTAYAAYRRWQLERIPRLPAALPCKGDGAAYFDPAQIGGRMPEWLDKETLDYCADSVGFFITEESSHEPDMPATIRATAAAGGIPDIRLLRRKQLFHLLVLVDSLAEGTRWNPLAQELADGLRRRGLPVTVGHVQGNLREFRTDEGRHWTLLELGEERGHYVVVVFADAGLLDRQKDRDVLEELQQWPQLAWLAFREQRHWGGAEQVLQQHGVHLWEASPRNLPDVFRHLAGEMLRYSLPQIPGRQWLAQQPQETLEGYLPRALGDALPLARLAALFPPPVSPALLVRLALAFLPHLPLLRVQRLYRVAGSAVDAGGLHLPLASIKLLRGQFHALNSDAQRLKIINTLLEWTLEAEPDDKHSPAWWAWRWRYARLLAEVDSDRAYPMLEAVEHSGLFAEGVAADLDSLPVSSPPKSASTLKNLYLLGKRHGYTLLDKAQALPGSGFWQRAVQAGSLVTVLLAVALGAWQFWPEPPPPPPPVIAEPSVSVPPVNTSLPAMVTIPGGTFEMGCVENKDCEDNEKPVHTVTVPAFEMGAYEVTNAQYVAFLNAVGQRGTQEQPWFETNSEDKTSRIVDDGGKYRVESGYDDHPAINISWYGAQAYLKWLSEQTKQAWRLPTEAEWEYAARAGTKTAYSWGDQSPVCDKQAANGAQFDSCTENAPVKVGSFKPNPFGLYDVHGNAWEWVEDCYSSDYKDTPADGTASPGCDANASRVLRVLRGGSWGNLPWTLRSANRIYAAPGDRGSYVGFRAARTINPLPFTDKGTAGQLAPPPQQGQAVQTASPPKAQLPTMVKIPRGTFEMGCVENKDCQDDEKPVHKVTVPAFEMGAYEVTVGQFRAFVDATQYQTTAEKDGSCWSYDASGSGIDVKGNSWRKTGYTQTDDSPVTCVSWQDAQAYLKWLSEQTKQAWRLPSEAEWEYATRGGTKTAYSWGDQPPVCDTQAANGAQFDDCKEKAPLKVGSFKPNPLGLYDVHGNAWEWVEDCSQGDYKNAPIDGRARQGCDADASRVLRGGSWGIDPQLLRSAYHGDNTPSDRTNSVGFRAARTINPLPFTEGGTQNQLAQAPQEGQAVQVALPATVTDTQKVPAPTMVQIPAGKFTMGCDPKRDDVEGGCDANEKPAHEVNVPTFWLSETEVTVGQYMACVKAGACPESAWQAKDAPSYYTDMGEALTGDNYPIVGVSWQNAQAYVQWLSKQTGKQYRLPTEAEWEYAARAGTDTAYSWGNSIGKNNANCYKDNCGDKFDYTSPVGSFAKSPFGLSDMHGNVLEWVEDCYADSYKDALADGTARPGCDANASRVLRGGSWYTRPQGLRSASRGDDSPDDRGNFVGFRAARTN